jgi:hypothetical protein
MIMTQSIVQMMGFFLETVLGLSLHRKQMAFSGRHQEQWSVVKRHYKGIFVLFKISQAKVLSTFSLLIRPIL